MFVPELVNSLHKAERDEFIALVTSTSFRRVVDKHVEMLTQSVRGINLGSDDATLVKKYREKRLQLDFFESLGNFIKDHTKQIED